MTKARLDSEEYEAFAAYASRASEPVTPEQIRAIVEWDGDSDEILPELTRDWIRACYHRPDDDEIRMHALDCMLGTFGVEALHCPEYPEGHYPRFKPHAVYLNSGDPYSQSLILTWEGELFAGSWGDYLEWAEQHDSCWPDPDDESEES